MAKRPAPTAIDYVAMAASPILIMALVGGLSFFLLAVLYDGQYERRLQWILTCYVLGTVLVTRIAIVDGREHASLYGAGLALAAALAAWRLADQVFVTWLVLAIIWWCADRLTWDCTLIDEDQDASGEGLLQYLQLDAQAQASTDAEGDTVGRRKRRPLWRRFFGTRRGHAPGSSVVFFSLAALPLFGVGQLMIEADDVGRRRYALLLLVVYVASALGLLLTTSLLGLRRYLRQRRAPMPGRMVVTWLGTGTVLVLAMLMVALLMPRPSPEYTLADVVPKLSSPVRNANDWAPLDFEPGEEEGQPGDESEEDGKAAGDVPGEEGKAAFDEKSSGDEAQQGEDGEAANKNEADGNQTQEDQTQDGNQDNAKDGGGEESDDSGAEKQAGRESDSGKSGREKNGGDRSDNSKGSSSKGSPSGESGKGESGKAEAGGGEGKSKSKSSGNADQKSESAQKSPSENKGQDQAEQSSQKSPSKNDASKDNASGSRNEDSAKSPDQKEQAGKGQPQQDQAKDKQQLDQEQPDKQAAGGGGQKQQSKLKNKDAKKRGGEARGRPKAEKQQRQIPKGESAQRRAPLTISTWLARLANFVDGVVPYLGLLILLVLAAIYHKQLGYWLRQMMAELAALWAGLFGTQRAIVQSPPAPAEAAQPRRTFADFRDPFETGQAEHMPVGELVNYSFAALDAWATDRGRPRGTDETPHEFAKSLGESYEDGAEIVGRLAALYARATYSRHELPANTRQTAAAAWRWFSTAVRGQASRMDTHSQLG